MFDSRAFFKQLNEQTFFLLFDFGYEVLEISPARRLT